MESLPACSQHGRPRFLPELQVYTCHCNLLYHGALCERHIAKSLLPAFAGILITSICFLIVAAFLAFKHSKLEKLFGSLLNESGDRFSTFRYIIYCSICVLTNLVHSPVFPHLSVLLWGNSVLIGFAASDLGLAALESSSSQDQHSEFAEYVQFGYMQCLFGPVLALVIRTLHMYQQRTILHSFPPEAVLYPPQFVRLVMSALPFIAGLCDPILGVLLLAIYKLQGTASWSEVFVFFCIRVVIIIAAIASLCVIIAKLMRAPVIHLAWADVDTSSTDARTRLNPSRNRFILIFSLLLALVCATFAVVLVKHNVGIALVAEPTASTLSPPSIDDTPSPLLVTYTLLRLIEIALLSAILGAVCQYHIWARAKDIETSKRLRGVLSQRPIDNSLFARVLRCLTRCLSRDQVEQSETAGNSHAARRRSNLMLMGRTSQRIEVSDSSDDDEKLTAAQRLMSPRRDEVRVPISSDDFERKMENAVELARARAVKPSVVTEADGDQLIQALHPGVGEQQIVDHSELLSPRLDRR